MYDGKVYTMEKTNILDTLVEAARKHAGSNIPEAAVVCDAWTSYCRSNAAVNFGSKLVKELDPEISRMVWDKIPTSVIAEACTAYWAGHDIPCPINHSHTEAAMPYAIGRTQRKLGGVTAMLMRIGGVKQKVVDYLHEKALTNTTEFVLEYLPGAASASAVAELTSQELVNYLVLLYLAK